jgi:hypothetical protein
MNKREEKRAPTPTTVSENEQRTKKMNRESCKK